MNRPEITAVREFSSEQALEEMRTKMPSLLYKYRSWSNKFQKATLLAPEIYFSAPSQLNDPFDIKLTYTWDDTEIFHPLFMEKLREQFPTMTQIPQGTRDFEVALSNYFEYIIKTNPQKWFEQNQEALRRGNIYDQLGLFCATTNPLDELMWAYYGDSYKGFCTGYDSIELWTAKPCEFGKVHYLSEPLEFSFINEEHIMDRFIDRFIKNNKWKHEDEYRFLTYIDNEKERLLPLNKSSIKEVYVGNKMNNDDISEIIECLKTDYHSQAKLFKVVDGPNSKLIAEQIIY
jgi:uncharacterized protein YeeX (DUF496 family)